MRADPDLPELLQQAIWPSMGLVDQALCKYQATIIHVLNFSLSNYSVKLKQDTVRETGEGSFADVVLATELVLFDMVSD